VSLSGPWEQKDHVALALDKSCRLRIHVKNVSCLYGLFVRHDWSGKIKITVNGAETDCFDLYSAYRFRQCLPLFVSETRCDADIEISILAANPFSRSLQMVFEGLLFLRHEAVGAVNRRGSEALLTPPIASVPELFRELQSQMVDRYRASLIDRGLDLEEEARRRWKKYAMRFREMLVYASPGIRMLDVGAGFLTLEFVQSLILPNALDYWVQDIDPRVVEHDQAVFSACGMDPGHVREGDNVALPYEDGFFDLVFSSHCLEHSSDLLRTFSEIQRVLKAGGVLFFAVPIGYDHSEEHVYALDVDGWRALTTTHDFEVINEHIGNIYPEDTHDLVIVARKLGPSEKPDRLLQAAPT
jgi:SAM-dependent methyltransferase